jgi:hypothetical protein
MLIPYLNKIETTPNMQKRISKATKFIESEVEKVNLEPGQKVGVVAHFVTIANMTAKGYAPGTRLGLKDHALPQNC